MTRHLLLVLALLLVNSPCSAGDIPRLVGRVNDYAGVLSAQYRAELELTLARYEEETTHQVAILTVKSLNGEAIETYSLRVAKSWALGRKGIDNGVLLTLAPDDHQVRVELGLGMSKYVSDAQAKGVIDSMTPAFRVGHFGDGLKVGITRLLEVCRAYKVPKRKSLASNYRFDRDSGATGFG